MMSSFKKKAKWLVPLCVIVCLMIANLIYGLIYYHADDIAIQALESSGTVAVSRTDYGWFFDGPDEDDLLVFYPGAKVEETAYAPLLHRLAEQGVDVCLVKMPMRFAIFAKNKADSVFASYEHSNRYICGHSLGGAIAADYASRHGDDLKGVILLAAYPVRDIDDQLFLLSIYGTEDGVLHMDKVIKARAYAPVNYIETPIDGGNHAQFGNYGMQNGDLPASISAEVQQAKTADLIVDIIKN